jgi:hypothetical protein
MLTSPPEVVSADRVVDITPVKPGQIPFRSDSTGYRHFSRNVLTLGHRILLAVAGGTIELINLMELVAIPCKLLPIDATAVSASSCTLNPLSHQSYGCPSKLVS